MSDDKYKISGGFGSSYGSGYGSGYQPAAPTASPAAPPVSGNSPASGPASAFSPSPSAGTPEPVKDISTAEFMTEVIEASKQKPVIIDFWAPWCGPCKQLAPALEKAVSDAGGKVKLVKMDIDKNPEIPGQMGIQSIPAVVAFIDGKPADAFMGAKPEGEIRAFIEKLAGPSGPSEIDMAIEEADGLRADDKLEEAMQLYMAILNAEPENLAAKTGLGLVYLANGETEGAKAILESISEDDLKASAVAGLKAAIDLAEQADDLGDVQSLIDQVEAEPANHESRLELAIALNGKGKREEAADHLLHIIKTDRAWNEEAAKKQLLQFFEAWGMTDETTVSARRKLSAILFS